jgi:hypothetical protein
MRTTLNIDDDLLRELRQRANISGSPLKKIVNKAIREGLREMKRPTPVKPYKCKTYSLGYPPRADLDHALDLAELMESEEIIRKLSLRK